MLGNNEQEIARLHEKVESLKEDIKDLKEDVKGLVSAWTAAQTFTSFIKWAASIATAITVLLAALKWKA